LTGAIAALANAIFRNSHQQTTSSASPAKRPSQLEDEAVLEYNNMFKTCFGMKPAVT